MVRRAAGESFLAGYQHTEYLGRHVHITPEEFENVALFLELGLPFTLIRHENEALRKHFSNRRDLKTPGLRLRGWRAGLAGGRG